MEECKKNQKSQGSSHFNVYLQSANCCTAEEADEFTSSAHRNTVAKRNTQERDEKKEMTKGDHFNP